MDTKDKPDKDAARHKPPSVEEVKKAAEEYAQDQREIINKLRRKID